MGTVNLHEFDGRKELAANLASDVAGWLQAAVDERGRATLAVSGGTTPRAFFVELSQKEIAWDKVTVTLVDERFVDETSERSNQRLVVGHLLQNRAARARFVPLFNDAGTPEEAAAHASAVIAGMPRPFDVVVLGMGLDGHTASFFPSADRLADALRDDAAEAVMPIRAPDAGEPRLTLTFPWLAQSRKLVLHIEGAQKKAVFEEAQAGSDEAETPIRAILNRAASALNVYWAD